MKKSLTVFCAFLLADSLFAQNWKKDMADPGRNFYTTQQEFYKDLQQSEKELRKEGKKQTKATKGEKEQELPGYELFKRWENYMEPRVYPSGDVRQVSRAYEEFQQYKQQHASLRSASGSGNPKTLSSTWMPLGPFGDPSGGNVGRVNVLRFE